MTTILHTADWHLGKPFGQFSDPAKVAALQQARLDAVEALGQVADREKVDAVVVCGDLFDSPMATRAVVCQALHRIAKIPCPVYVIPGNHDHAGPGTLWHLPFFEAERASLAPNLTVLLERKPVELEGIVLLPCPLMQRHTSMDSLGWLTGPAVWAEVAPGKPRMVLAHGTVEAFGSDPDTTGMANYLDPGRLPPGEVDYVALGDWHGIRQVGPAAWYSGTPEPDRFPRGADYRAGCALLVKIAGRRAAPVVEPVETGRLTWVRLAVELDPGMEQDRLLCALEEVVGNRVGGHVVDMKLSGTLGLSALTALEDQVVRYRARVVELMVENRVLIAPNAEDLAALASRPQDPVIAKVAERLKKELESQNRELDRAALLALHRLVREKEAA